MSNKKVREGAARRVPKKSKKKSDAVCVICGCGVVLDRGSVQPYICVECWPTAIAL